MEATNTISVEQEVEAILTVQAATYANSAYVLESPASEFYSEVADALKEVLALYQDRAARNIPVEVSEPEVQRARILKWEAGASEGDLVNVISVREDGELKYVTSDGLTYWASQGAYELIDALEEAAKPEPVTFKVGDRVVLTGPSWEAAGIGGEVVKINAVESDGGASFDDPRDGTPWYAEPDPTSNWYVRLVDDEIRVGDTVRITEAYGAKATEGNEIGAEFVVTEIKHSPWDYRGEHMEFFVQGDAAGRGVWDIYIEKVHA